MTFEIRQYEYEDEKAIKPVDKDALFNHPDYFKIWDAIVEPYWTKTALWNGKVIFVAGIIFLKEEPYVWLVADKSILKVKTTFVRTMKQIIRILDSYRFSRVKTLCRKDFNEGCKFLEHLGFQKTDNEFSDYLIYEKG